MDSKELSQILTRVCGIKGGKVLLVGVSGGADSLCLLSLLRSLDLPVLAAYFNHNLRPESAQDGLTVARFAARLGCEFVLGEGDVRGLAASKGLSLEAAARKARYRFLFEQARRSGAEAVVVGHTADDQVETILLHLLRGSGLDGLKGMSYRTLLPEYSPDIPLIRPLLGYWRDETTAYCAEHGLQPVEDASNRERRYLRNRVRLELIPYLQTYNPEIKKRLWAFGQVAQTTLSATDEIVDWAYRRCLLHETKGQYAALSIQELLELDDGWLARVIRAAVARIRAEPSDLDYRAVQRVLQFLRRPDPVGQVDLTANLVMIKVHGRVYLTDRRMNLPTGEWPQMAAPELVELTLPGDVQLDAGWRLRAEFQNVEPNASISDLPLEAWLDMGGFEQNLGVRAWRKGDRFQPLGMSGTIKLSDFFVNRKIPRISRARWPLVVAGEDIVWVAGLRISEKYRLKAESRRAVRLILERRE